MNIQVMQSFMKKRRFWIVQSRSNDSNDAANIGTQKIS